MADTYELDSRGRNVILKDPSAILDYPFDWSDWLEPGDTIASVVFTVDTVNGLTKESSSHTDTIAVVWVGGGIVGTIAFITCHVLTTKGREDDRSIYVKIKER